MSKINKVKFYLFKYAYKIYLFYQNSSSLTDLTIFTFEMSYYFNFFYLNSSTNLLFL